MNFTVIPRFTLQLLPKKGGVGRITTYVRGNKKFDDEIEGLLYLNFYEIL